MARRSKRSSRTGRVNLSNASDELLGSLPFAVSGRPLLPVEDRRQYTPSAVTPPRTLRGVSRLVLFGSGGPKRRSRARISSPIGFAIPESTMVCVRRSRRREVLHALGKTGGRGGSQRRPRRGPFSHIVCRRR